MDDLKKIQNGPYFDQGPAIGMNAKKYSKKATAKKINKQKNNERI